MIHLFSKYGITIAKEQEDLFNIYYEFLTEENKKYNITAITDYREVIVKHFLDSVVVSKYFDFRKVQNCIDIGTGGGFPLVPLKILYPHLEITLVDSMLKRINFLNSLNNILKINNIQTIHSRAEDLAKTEHREKYDVSIARAVADTSIISEYCLPFVKVGGHMLLLKGNMSKEEIYGYERPIRLLGGEISNCIIDIRIEDNSRSIIEVEKRYSTSNKYPRKPGKAKKKPL